MTTRRSGWRRCISRFHGRPRQPWRRTRPRKKASTLDRLMTVVKRGPDVTTASKVGEPTLVDPTPVAANQVAGTVMRQAMGIPAGEKGLSGEIVKADGPPGANEAAPRSDAPATAANADLFARPNTATAADPNELKPAAAPDANELKPDPNELKPAEK